MTRFSQPWTRPFLTGRPLQTGLAAVCAALTACATVPAPVPSQPAAQGPGIEHNTAPSAATIDWSARGEPAQLARIIAQLTEITRQSPTDGRAWVKLAEAHCLMADGISVLGWKDQDEPGEHLAAAESAALSAHALSEKADAESLRERRIAGLDSISENRGITAYWFARSAYARAALLGYEALLLDHAVLEHAVHVAFVGAPNVDRGGPHRLIASLVAHPADPSLRDLAKAKQQVEQALSIDPKNPANLLAYVEHYAVPAQDGAAVTEKLQQLAQLTASSPEDAIALARAKRLASSIESRLE